MTEERLKLAESLLRRYYEYTRLPLEKEKIEVFTELEADILSYCERYLKDTAAGLKLVVQRESAGQSGLSVISQQELVTDPEEEQQLMAFSESLREASDLTSLRTPDIKEGNESDPD